MRGVSSALPLAAAAPFELELAPWLGLTLALLLVLLNGFFVAAEFALVKVRPTQLDPHVAAGSYRGKVARHMVSHLDAYLSATQLGITLASLALGWIGEPAFAWLIEPVVMQLPFASPALLHTLAITLAFLVITSPTATHALVKAAFARGVRIDLPVPRQATVPGRDDHVERLED